LAGQAPALGHLGSAEQGATGLRRRAFAALDPHAALAAGADILVIGRAITGAKDPARAAQDILGTLHGR
jgi:orotidine-5'-phosphate decarboxylase